MACRSADAGPADTVESVSLPALTGLTSLMRCACLALTAALGLLAAFALWTALVRSVDMQSSGPNSSAAGFAAWNGDLRRRIGIHWTFCCVTDWLGLVPLGIPLGFALVGLAQWRKRKHLLAMDGRSSL